MGDEPIREYESRTEPFDEEHLATARRTLTKAQSMDWLADGEATAKDGHKTPCIPANDLEWLFGYVDSLRATLATERAEGERLRRGWHRTHPDASLTGADQTPLDEADKVWRCDVCGLTGTSAELDAVERELQANPRPEGSGK
ncbi:MAG: hypothetical protein ACLP62_01340 [Acidimicrobiales bacterium]